MPQVKRDGLVEVTEREVQWDEYVAGLGGGDDAVLNEEQAKVAIERVCSGLLIPDTDLGENPRRERGV
ncbi:hypothetical protein A6681_22620 [Pseudomonas aeruginosa]|nr:hypothetical protein AM599_22630 [Pseudomonas aeruginosa]AON14650.1 hypothetical protein A6681_22620 [Pseudomonas aeruginosa]AON20659.1 hypothetical protein A7331_22760 [Pseudomonas aeruginosa]AON26643.1 hypothetical protein A6688_22640 [Pseudomonas aeruginosa]AON32652.1 hypothetical protein A6695_22760 [Pseudomonas aeruginosa]